MDEKKKKEHGGWIFLSHSHQDIDLVRQIRNQFEALGFEPLMFYLKCLSDQDEIEELIRREIDERDWFVYIDSPAARTSKWVKTERDYIEKLEGKKVFTIDSNESLAQQLKRVKHIADQLKVYLSYSHNDAPLAERIIRKLLAKDLRVIDPFDPAAFSVGESFAKTLHSSIRDASHSGFVLVLITEHSLDSALVQSEVEETLAQKGKLVPVYVGKASLSQKLLEKIGNVQGVHLSEQPSDEELDKVLEFILHRVEYYDSDFRSSYGFENATNVEYPALATIDDDTFASCENLKTVVIPDSVIYISKNAFRYQPDILVKCHAGSYAEGYCINHGIRYEII